MQSVLASAWKSIQADACHSVEESVRKVDASLQGPAVFIKSGWENLAFGIEDRVARFPKDKETFDALRREAEICQYVLGLTQPLETPDLAVHEEADGYAFSLHRKIGSGLFSRKKYEALTCIEKDMTAEQLAVFFMRMHETPLSHAKEGLGVKERSGPSCYQTMAKTVDEKLDPDLQEFGHTVVREYRNWPAENQQLVFGHFDLHDGNMGADSQGKLVGVFDFADCAIDDVHADFAPLLYVSPDLVARTVDRYAAMTGKTIDPRRIAIAGAMCEISDLAGDRGSPETPEFFNQKLREWHKWHITLPIDAPSQGVLPLGRHEP